MHLVFWNGLRSQSVKEKIELLWPHGIKEHPHYLRVISRKRGCPFPSFLIPESQRNIDERARLFAVYSSSLIRGNSELFLYIRNPFFR